MAGFKVWLAVSVLLVAAAFSFAIPTNGGGCDNGACPPTPTPTITPSPSPQLTIIAHKIVCDNEFDLPNWGAGGPDVNAATASDFVAQHPNCHFANDWNFQWAYSSASNPGDEVGEAAGWNTFGPTDLNGMTSVSIADLQGSDRLWVREVFKDGYLEFSGQNTVENYSAELYCYEDSLNYDNYDYILNPQLGTTYYCVAWNVRTQPEPYCGDGIVQGDEQCELSQYPDLCTENCVWKELSCVQAKNLGYIQGTNSISGGSATVWNTLPEGYPFSYDIGLAVYEKFDEYIPNQTLFDSDTGVSNAGENLVLNVELPSCKYQIDLFCGEVIEHFDPEYYNDRKIDYEHSYYENNEYCEPDFQLLTLASECNGLWKVENPNDFEASFDWNVVDGNESGSGVVPASGVKYFTTLTGEKTVQLYVDAVFQDDAVASEELCCSPNEYKPQPTLIDPIDRVNIGDTADEVGHNLLGWSTANIEGNYGGKDDGTYRQLIEEWLCNDQGRPASLDLNAGNNFLLGLRLRNLDGLSNYDSFDAYLNGNLIAHYIDMLDSQELWFTQDYYAASDPATPVINANVNLVATDAVWPYCQQYGQVAFSWAEIYGYSCEPNAICGNGIVEQGEECDDGNVQSGDGCSSECTTESVNLVVHKIVCDDEADLPNWAYADMNINAATAADFVAQNPNCHFQDGVNFQWGYYGDVSFPDGNSGEAGSGWNTFGPTDENGYVGITVPIEGKDNIGVREIRPDGYIPFSLSSNDVSAEFYCHVDAYLYDNQEVIGKLYEQQGLEDGKTYYCVAFNALIPEPSPTPSVSPSPEPSPTPSVSPTPTPTNCFASSVVVYNPAKQKDGGDLPPERMNPLNALGAPQNDDTINFVSLGFGGDLTLGFDKQIMNVAGNDVKVTETSFGSPACSAYPETLRLFASKDGISWTDLGTGCLDSEFDLGSLDYANFLKFVDESNPASFGDNDDAFDVDGVEAFYCEEPTPTPSPSPSPSPEPVTIIADKIVCDNEADLPNWGTGGPDVNAATASDFVAQHPNCRFASDWNFQWSYSTASNPGDNTGEAGSGWNTFGPTDGTGTATVFVDVSQESTRLQVREIFQEDYLEFAYDATGNSNDVSAEIYCHTDVLNYDNFDWIFTPIAGETYYCVAWNVKKEVPCDPELELVSNGGFELPVANNSYFWDIFPSGSIGLDWLLEWNTNITTYQDRTRPEIANIEYQFGYGSWVPVDGRQYAELDSDWFGPSDPLNGEPASVKIYQDLTTVPGQTYKITFAFSPRPETGASNNQLEFSWDNGVKDTISADGGSSTAWTQHDYEFVATSNVTRLQFADAGTPDSLGTFIDGVSVRCVASPSPSPSPSPEPTVTPSPSPSPNPDSVNLVVHKIVCDNEADLPNWGYANQNINAETAQAFVSQHPNCHFQSGVTFQWGYYGDVSFPDDNSGEAGSGWNTFGPTDENGYVGITVPIEGKDNIGVREIRPSEYIPFSLSENDVSAEFYCHVDAYLYDNREVIGKLYEEQGLVAGTTYYCVAWNVPVITPSPTPEPTITPSPTPSQEPPCTGCGGGGGGGINIYWSPSGSGEQNGGGTTVTSGNSSESQEGGSGENNETIPTPSPTATASPAPTVMPLAAQPGAITGLFAAETSACFGFLFVLALASAALVYYAAGLRKIGQTIALALGLAAFLLPFVAWFLMNNACDATIPYAGAEALIALGLYAAVWSKWL